ncbi:MAG TPA: hypothetical protein VH419_11770 [Nocardioidaceae bacterium]|jgi:membrane protein
MRPPQYLKNVRARADGVVKLADAGRDWAQRTIVWRVWERMLENEFVDRSVALGAKAFVSFFPAIIVLASFAPPSIRTSIGQAIVRHGGLTGDGLSTFNAAFGTSDSIRRATGVLGLIFTFFYVSSFTSALQRVYVRAWRRPPASKVSSYALGAVWLAGIFAYLSMIGGMRVLLGHGPELAVFALLALAGSIALWWITPWFMLSRKVRLRVLFPTGLVTGVALSLYGATAFLWMPRTMSQNQAQFGFFGVALSLVTWFSGSAIIVVIGACAAPVLAEDRGFLGRLSRGSDPAVLVPGAKPSFGAPVRAPTLIDAIRLRTTDDEVEAQPTIETPEP